MFFKVSWRSVEQQYGSLLKDFRRHRKSVEKEAELAHLVEAEKARAVGRAEQQQQDKQNSGTQYCLCVSYVLLTFPAEIERRRLLSLLSSIQWEQQHSRILDLRHPGTGTWILTKDIFERWTSAIGTHQQPCLWCYGIRKSVSPNA